MVERKSRWLDPAIFFLIAGLFVGSVYCIVIPYGAGFDEEGHLVRIYHMSRYRFMPVFPQPLIYEEVFNLSYQRRPIQTPAFDMYDGGSLSRRFNRAEENIRYGYQTRSIYSPVIFLPQAFMARILWWEFDLPILPTVMVQRFAGLLVYLAGCYAAIRALPYGKWMMAALALSPMALFQASTLNADGLTYAVSFLFIAWVLRVYVEEHDGIQPRSLWILTAVAILLGLAKPVSIILLPLLLILFKHPFPSKKWMWILIGGALLSILVNVGWMLVSIPGSTFSESGQTSIPRQLDVILADPIPFLTTFTIGVISSIPTYIQDWMAAYGYWAGIVPGPVYFFYTLFLLTAFLTESRPLTIPLKVRAFMTGLFVFCSLVFLGMFFVVTYIPEGPHFLGKHGRYLIPFAPLFLLSLPGSHVLSERRQRMAQFTAIASFVAVIGFYSFGMYTAYYTHCGYDAYTGGKCTLPVYKNLDKDEPPILELAQGTLVSQTFTAHCNGLEAVGVYLKSIPESSEGSIRFTLLDEHHQIIASRDFPLSAIIIGNYLNLPAKPSPGLKNTLFEIQLESVDLSLPQRIEVALTPPDYYDGELSVNGKRMHNDLILRYVCERP
jgi:uncharacterized membrane protein